MNQELARIFNSHNLRLTTPRKAVFIVLHQSSQPLSVASIAKLCITIDRTSVYRTIALFARLGIVEAVPQGWKQCYELADPFKVHHHHLTCTKCGRLIDVHSEQFEHFVIQIAKQQNFTIKDHTFEIRGLCETCR